MKTKIKRSILLLIILLMILSPVLLTFLQETFSLRIACVGDSITYGAKIQDKFLHSYPAQLQQLLGGK